LRSHSYEVTDHLRVPESWSILRTIHARHRLHLHITTLPSSSLWLKTRVSNILQTHINALTLYPTGVGVGDSSASPTAALLLSVLQESMGRIATILFAHRLGTALEPECKMYRLAADVFNDTAIVLDCLSPAFPKPLRVLILGFSSILRSLCGVCAGSAKASLSAHFAKKGNLGELNAVSWVCSARPEQRLLFRACYWRCFLLRMKAWGCWCFVLMKCILGCRGVQMAQHVRKFIHMVTMLT
jgi:hypothetical protein